MPGCVRRKACGYRDCPTGGYVIRPYGCGAVSIPGVGVDVLIDPRKRQRPGTGGGMRACRPTVRCELRAADSRPYGCGAVSIPGVGVDVLIDPRKRQRPGTCGGMRACRPTVRCVRRYPCGNRRCPTGGHKARPYIHAPGALVGAAFMAARARVRRKNRRPAKGRRFSIYKSAARRSTTLAQWSAAAASKVG